MERETLPVRRGRQSSGGVAADRAIYREKSVKNREIREKCASKEPETYEERQKRHDLPAFKDNQREWYKCAEKAGYDLTAPDENGEFGLAKVGPNGDAASPKMEACRKQAFTDRAGEGRS